MIQRDTLYVQVYSDRFVVRNMDSGSSSEVDRDQTYASPRMLIADFTFAERQLKGAVKSVKRGLLAPDVLFHPMEKIEGGLTQVEFRVFRELGLGVGANRVATWEGEPPPGSERMKQAIREYVY